MQESGRFDLGNLQLTDAYCEEAERLLDVDLIGVPTGPFPPRSLAILIGDISLAIVFVDVNVATGNFECFLGRCTVPSTEQEGFLELAIAPAIPELEAFTIDASVINTILARPGIDDIAGLEVE